MTALVRASSNCERLIGPVVRDSAPKSTNPQLSDSNKNLVVKSQIGALFQEKLAD
jgi:hypothetical protein